MKERAVKCTGGGDSDRTAGKPKHIDHSRCLAGALRRNRGQAGRVQQSKSGANAGGNQQKRKYHPNISIGCRY